MRQAAFECYDYRWLPSYQRGGEVSLDNNLLACLTVLLGVAEIGGRRARNERSVPWFCTENMTRRDHVTRSPVINAGSLFRLLLARCRLFSTPSSFLLQLIRFRCFLCFRTLFVSYMSSNTAGQVVETDQQPQSGTTASSTDS